MPTAHPAAGPAVAAPVPPQRCPSPLTRAVSVAHCQLGASQCTGGMCAATVVWHPLEAGRA